MPYIYPQPPSSSSPDPITRVVMSETMLLTKPLSTFLANNTTPHLHTLLLLSPTGKLLSSSSPSPASTLRTQATLACSLWSLYHPFSSTTLPLISSSLPTSQSPPRTTEQELNSITVQLEFGIMCIRSLKSGLLFVAIGPASTPSPFPTSQHLQQQISTSRTTSPPASPGVGMENGHGHGGAVSLSGEVLSGSASEAGSVGTERSVGQATIWGVRRQAEEVGRWLEGALQGFVLSAGER